MTHEQMIVALRSANEVARKTMEQGHHPFGAVLIGPDGDTVLLEAGNVDTVRHAETELAREASLRYDPEFLWRCTLVTNFEPCVMCTGTIYWANIGRVVYGVSESSLLQLTGAHDANPTMSLPCRVVIEAGQKTVEVHGPFPEVEAEILQLHVDFWR
ncbi:nucleoside deaminase [Coraliomargarita parva]|uniref:nucleoside deaminase n=1 Tax=Coraliomargarita parva TaxID=3014050 RepID=UPI0022B3E6C9|nr:nucleoside deaminase [Coraliomargarita parva]